MVLGPTLVTQNLVNAFIYHKYYVIPSRFLNLLSKPFGTTSKGYVTRNNQFEANLPGI